MRDLRRLRALVVVDDLTQLHNSRSLAWSLAREVHRARRYERNFSLILLDLDRYKEVNDRYGYDAGDSVLKDVASFLRSRVRSADELFRYKRGDELAILAPDTTMAGAIALAERLRRDLEQVQFSATPRAPFRAGPSAGAEPVAITLSAGVATFEPSEDTGDGLRRRAEAALERAKRETNAVAGESSEGAPPP